MLRLGKRHLNHSGSFIIIVQGGKESCGDRNFRSTNWDKEEF